MHSERARSWFEQTGDEQFLFCRFTQITALNYLTRPTGQVIMGVRLERIPRKVAGVVGKFWHWRTGYRAVGRGFICEFRPSAHSSYGDVYRVF